MRRQHIFIDEYGDTSLSIEKEGVTSLYVVAAIFIASAEVEDVQAEMRQIQRDFFGNSEIKSSKIGSNDRRRLKVLDAVLDIPFKFYAFSADKASINEDSGLIYKRSFIKFLQGQLYRRIYRAYPDLEIYADRQGSEDFLKSFSSYLERKHKPTLFSTATVSFVDSRSSPLIQLADFIVGTLGRALDPKKTTAEDYLGLLEDHAILIDEWPMQARTVTKPGREPSGDNFDHVVREQSFAISFQYLEDNRDATDEVVQQRIEVLKYLIFVARFLDDKRFIATKKLLRLLEDQLGEEVSEHAFRSDVIAGLRDADVIIASGPSGYKLPVSEADIESFVSHAHQIIKPMLERLKLARDPLLLATRGDFDILHHNKHVYLRRLLDSTDDSE